MKSKTNLLYFLAILIVFISCEAKNDSKQRTELLLIDGWLFAKDLPNNDYSLSNLSDSLFSEVMLPHTAQLEPLVVNNQWQGVCWYRKWLAFTEQQSNQKHFLYFEGAMQEAYIYFNGKLIKEHAGGYLPFIVDISDQIDYTKANLLAIKLINTDDTLIPPGKTLKTLDFNMYGGLYRPVKLISTSKVYITNPMQSYLDSRGGIFVQFDAVSPEYAQLTVRATIANDEEEINAITIQQVLLDTNHIAVVSSKLDHINISPNQSAETLIQLRLNHPELWSPSHPYLYQLATKIYKNNQLIDSLSTKVGIKSLQLTDSGLILNGEKTFLRGTNRHQEYPYIGYALSNEAQWRDAVKIKEAGFDLVRLSHYPHSEAFMDACDALGLVTMNCIPGWQYNGIDIFKSNVLQNTRDLIRRDRNHPSVFFWELSLNESWMEPEFMDRILKVKEEEMDNQQALTCAWIDYAGYDLFIPARQHGQPPYYWNDYKSGKRPVFIAEYGDWEYYAQNAGFNQTAYADLQDDERTSRQLRGAGEKRLLQQALNYQEAANSNRKGSSTIGHANWLMFDYNRGYSDDIESSGISDIFRLPKFAHYFYQSQRDAEVMVAVPVKNGPMVFIANYWQPESTSEIRVFSNCEEVELRLNGKPFARQKPDNDFNSTNLTHPPFTFKLDKFESGQLSAFGYINGIKVAGDWVRTPEEPFQIALKVDESGIPLHQNDVVFLYAILQDKNGTICQNNSSVVTFEIEGDGQFIGENPIQFEAGIATILLKTGIKSGKIRLSAKTDTLTSKTTTISY